MTGATGPPPLDGIRILELGSFIAGPFCAQILADFGAEVIKVESPISGDPMRQWGVHLHEGRSLWWPVIGRNRKCITLDLHHPTGQELARALAGKVDVLIENFRPGTLEEWGLAPGGLLAAHPGLIVARLSAFGQTGPYRDRPGFGSVAEAMGGLRYLTGFPDRPPPRVGLSIGDSVAGLHAAFGVMLALRHREVRGGNGQVIDAAITEAVLAMIESVLAEYSKTGAVRERTGSVLPGVAPSNLYETRDGRWIIIAANADGVFARLAHAMRRPEWTTDPEYATHRGRGRHQAELDEAIGAWARTFDAADLLNVLERAGVPFGSVYTAADIAADPHFRERGAVVTIDDPSFGPLAMQAPAPKLSATPGRIRWAGPPLGADNDEIYGRYLGLDEAALAALRDKGVI